MSDIDQKEILQGYEKIYNITKRYQIQKLTLLNELDYLAIAKDTKTNKTVMIKRKDPIENLQDAKRILREIRILKAVVHRNVNIMWNILLDNSNEQEGYELFFIYNFMDLDLYQLIKKYDKLHDGHVQYIIYQLLVCLIFLHDNNIIHRAIEPVNILINESSEIKLIGLHNSRIFDKQTNLDNAQRTEYITKNFYRAPEVILSSSKYGKEIDIWSVGCVMAEMILKRPLFSCKDYKQHITQIFTTCQQPDDIDFIKNPDAKDHIQNQVLPNLLFENRKVSYHPDLKDYCNEDALDLLDKLLQIDPKQRITAQQAVKHQYFIDFYDSDEILADKKNKIKDINLEFEEANQLDCQQELKKLILMIVEEINYFKDINHEKPIYKLKN